MISKDTLVSFTTDCIILKELCNDNNLLQTSETILETDLGKRFYKEILAENAKSAVLADYKALNWYELLSDIIEFVKFIISKFFDDKSGEYKKPTWSSWLSIGVKLIRFVILFIKKY